MKWINLACGLKVDQYFSGDLHLDDVFWNWSKRTFDETPWRQDLFLILVFLLLAMVPQTQIKDEEMFLLLMSAVTINIWHVFIAKEHIPKSFWRARVKSKLDMVRLTQKFGHNSSLHRWRLRLTQKFGQNSSLHRFAPLKMSKFLCQTKYVNFWLYSRALHRKSQAK